MTSETEPIESHAPRVEPGGVTFSLPDRDSAFVAVDLAQEVLRPRIGPRFSKADGASEWRLFLARPRANRIEYRLALTRPSGDVETICDPGNPVRAPGAFGDKSVVEWPEYRAPKWEQEATEEGTRFELTVASKVLNRDIPVVLWTTPGRSAPEPLPLLLVHDGIEYDKFSRLTHFLSWATSVDQIPPLRVALLAPVDRNEFYSASGAYAHALAHEVIPALGELAPAPHGRRMRIGVGASLGALAMFHGHRTNPATFGGLFLQSGSFFRRRTDAQEAGFASFGRITRFMDRVTMDSEWAHPITVGMTCGTAEENLLNNRFTRSVLVEQGYEVLWHEHPDAHNWISWRDSLDPGLTQLIRRLWA